MAKIIDGEISGKFRDMIFRKTKEFGVIAVAYNEHVYKNKVWSDTQSYARRRFKTLAGLSATFRLASNLGFELGKKVLSHPSFIKYNYNVLIDREDGWFDVDYENVCISKGVLPQLEDLSGEIVDNTLELNWKYTEKHYAKINKQRVNKSLKGDRSRNDRVVVVAHCPDYNSAVRCKSAIFDDGILRENEKLTIEIPNGFNELKVYFYAFVIDSENRSSDTQFVLALEGTSGSEK